MIHLRKFNENKEIEKDSIYNIVMHMANIIDDYEVIFSDIDGNYTESLDVKNDTDFKFSTIKYNFIKSKFSIVISDKINFDDYINQCSDMQQVIEYLSNYGWKLLDHSFEKDKNKNGLVLHTILYTFVKPDKFDNNGNSLEKVNTKSNIVKTFDNHLIKITQRSITYQDNFDDFGDDYDINPSDLSKWIQIDGFRIFDEVEINRMSDDDKYEFLQEMLDGVCEELGGDEWTLHNDRYIRIYFNYKNQS